MADEPTREQREQDLVRELTALRHPHAPPSEPDAAGRPDTEDEPEQTPAEPPSAVQ